MVAGDAKKVVVIKNISSNLIEEVILILKSEPGTQECNRLDKPVSGRVNARNDFILKEAESIINQYIRENGLTKVHGRNRQRIGKIPHINISINALINILLMAAIAVLVLAASKIF